MTSLRLIYYSSIETLSIYLVYGTDGTRQQECTAIYESCIEARCASCVTKQTCYQINMYIYYSTAAIQYIVIVIVIVIKRRYIGLMLVLYCYAKMQCHA